MAKKKQVLSLENEIDFVLFGLSSHSKDYRLSFFLNKSLDMIFEKNEDLELKNKNNESYFYSVYSALNDDGFEFVLISNKCDGSYLLPELKQWDYFLLIKSLMREQDKIVVWEKLKTTNLINLCAEIDLSKVKSIGNIIF